jgi:hypothetical protein
MTIFNTYQYRIATLYMFQESSKQFSRCSKPTLSLHTAAEAASCVHVEVAHL